jgi:hypothetical protein
MGQHQSPYSRRSLSSTKQKMKQWDLLTALQFVTQCAHTSGQGILGILED